MIVLDFEQNTPEWYAARLGIPTASNFDKIVTATGARSASRSKYMDELFDEIITGERADKFYGAAMKRGHKNEDESRKYYEFLRDCHVEQPGFCFKDELKRFGSSPDGLVSPDGGFETKDAAPHVQEKRLIEGWTGSEYHRQVMGNMMVTGREWWDLVSYCRGLSPVIIRFERDEHFISLLEKEVNLFCDELDERVRRVRNIMVKI